MALQFLLVGAILACGFSAIGWPQVVESIVRILGLVVGACGLILLALGSAALGRSLTPLPRPRARGELKQQGIYRLVRHPVYGGAILLAVGWSVGEAPLGLVPSALLATVFELKRRREEAWLVERYPEYATYRVSTPRRFVPWLL